MDLISVSHLLFGIVAGVSASGNNLIDGVVNENGLHCPTLPFA